MADDKTHFVVQDAEDGKRYKVFLKPQDFGKLKVGKIRKTLSIVAKLEANSFDLTLNGAELEDHITGIMIGLNEATVLSLHKKVPPQRAAEAFSTPEPPMRQQDGMRGTPDGPQVIDLQQHSTQLGTVLQQQTPEIRSPPHVEQYVAASAYHALNGTHMEPPPADANVTPPRMHRVATGSPSPKRDLMAQTKSSAMRRSNSQSQSRGRSTSVPLTLAQLQMQERLLREAKAKNIVDDSGLGLQDIVGSGDKWASEDAPAKVTTTARPAPARKEEPPLPPQTRSNNATPEERFQRVPTAGVGMAVSAAYDSPELVHTETSDLHQQPPSQAALQSYHYVRVPTARPPNADVNTSTNSSKLLDGAQVPDHTAALSRHELLSQWKMEVAQLRQVWEEDCEAWEVEREELELELQRTKAANLGLPRDADAAPQVASEELEMEVSELSAAVVSMQSQRHVLSAEVIDLRNRLGTVTRELKAEKLRAEAATDSLMRLEGPLFERLGSESRDSLRQTLGACIGALVSKRQLDALQRENAVLQAQLLEEGGKRRELHSKLEEAKGNIRVIVRVRPPMHVSAEDVAAMGDIPHFDKSRLVSDELGNAIAMVDPQTGTRQFEFYRVLGEATLQGDVFAEISPLVQTALDGYNVGILAYGQTGSGKTHTILGPPIGGGFGGADITKEGRGALPRALELLFDQLNALPEETMAFSVRCSMMELYVDQLRDLLAPKTSTGASVRCDVKTVNGVTRTVGVSQHQVRSADDAMALLHAGNDAREVHATQQNASSSRSHAIFTANVATRNKLTGTERQSKLVFVDLAGSERVARSQSAGERLKEAQYINKSLSALGDVVHALSKGQADTNRGNSATAVGQSLNPSTPFVPYRNSKLTLLLQDCIGGNAKTLLIACVAPNNLPYECNTHETLNTLQFASRVKRVQNVASRTALLATNGNTAVGSDTSQDNHSRGRQPRSASASAAERTVLSRPSPIPIPVRINSGTALKTTPRRMKF